jgi:GNAT superfamily N-acetyltransferase
MTSRLLQRWFNARPTREAKPIRDRSGKKFWLVWDVDRFECAAEMHLTRRGRWVGILSALREADRSITLADIMVLDRDSLRRRGLGRAMLQEFIAWAQANHYKSIRGIIQTHDGSSAKSLAVWFKRQGFTVADGRLFLALPDRSQEELSQTVAGSLSG